MAMRMISLRGRIAHLVAWASFGLYEQSVFFLLGNAPLNLWQVLAQYLLNVGLFYLHSTVLLPWYYGRRHYGHYLLSTLAALAFYSLLRTELYLHLFPDLREPALPLKDSYYRFGVLSLYRGTFFLLISAGYWFARQAVGLERQQRQQEQLLLTAEKSIMASDLAFLKSQISPHFLFNSLNFLYAQVPPRSAAATSILLLADTMRYALQESHGGKVMLEDEVQHLQNYLALHQLRFNNELEVHFELLGDVRFLMVLPLVLITFVENCLKHGELRDAAHPVLLRLEIERGQLRFHTRNKKRLGPKEPGTSIGLVNTRRRLALTYPERHLLNVTDGPDCYTTTLLIDL